MWHSGPCSRSRGKALPTPSQSLQLASGRHCTDTYPYPRRRGLQLSRLTLWLLNAHIFTQIGLCGCYFHNEGALFAYQEHTHPAIGHPPSSATHHGPDHGLRHGEADLPHPNFPTPSHPTSTRHLRPHIRLRLPHIRPPHSFQSGHPPSLKGPYAKGCKPQHQIGTEPSLS